MKKEQKIRPFFNRIRTRLFVTILLILIIFFTVLCAVAAPALTAVLIYRTCSELSEISENINYVSPGSSTYYFDLFTIAANNNVSFELINPDGTVAYQSSEGYSAQSSSHIYSFGETKSEYSQTEFVTAYSARNKSGTFEKRRKIATGSDVLVYSDELSTGETVHIFSSVTVIDSNVEVATRVFTLICIFICLVILIFVYYYISKFSKPLEEMNDVTKDMASLNFARKCKPYGNDEIGELGKSINVLSHTLDTTLLDLREKNKQLQNDIDYRREFISNVSHELKTPIAIISGYAEGLSAGISDDPTVVHEYCEIISEESKKMNSLVVELLELSKLENKGIELKAGNYCLSDQIKEIINHFSLLAANNGISITNHVPENLFCHAQQDKIEIVLNNYISNAVAHCSGEKQISVFAEDKSDRYLISVYNSGEKIKEEDISRIWDSFYRADKSRQRSQNRFGLGLSIVKAITSMHSMGCYVKNEENGVTFSFEVEKSSNED